MTRKTDQAPYLWRNEEVVVELDGVISGYSRWSGVSGITAIFLALLIPALIETSFLVGVIIVVATITIIFLGVYYLIGRPLAAKAEPPMESPYLRLVLTDKRVLLFDRGLGGDGPGLLEESAANDVSTVRYQAATMLQPHRLGYVIQGTKRRQFEFPRGQNVGAFAEHFS